MTLIRVVRHLLAHERFWDSFIPRTSLPQVPPYPRRYGSYQKFCQTSPACGFQGRAIHSTTNRVIYFPSVGWIWFCICDLIFSSPMASDSACKGVLCSIYVLFFFSEFHICYFCRLTCVYYSAYFQTCDVHAFTAFDRLMYFYVQLYHLLI